VLFQLFFIRFTTAIYFLDYHIVQLIERIHVRLKHTILVVVTTTIIAIIDGFLLPILKFPIRSDFEMKLSLNKIYIYSDFTLPFVCDARFLVLFFNYYRENIKIY
jgi:hypothetical protein